MEFWVSMAGIGPGGFLIHRDSAKDCLNWKREERKSLLCRKRKFQWVACHAAYEFPTSELAVVCQEQELFFRPSMAKAQYFYFASQGNRHIGPLDASLEDA